tara:strand:+ start:812 stop:997 length:186 start_codon:yes stop_codon:yes gene_type:complete
MERETIDGYTLEDSYWTGNFYDVDDELEQQARLENNSKVWREYGDIMEDALEGIFDENNVV